MLPTDKATAAILVNLRSGNLYCDKQEDYHHLIKLKDWRGRHLYIVTDDEIKEGDWYYWVITNTVQQFKSVDGDKPSDDCKKIIATTDTELTGIKQEWEEFEGDWHKSNKLGLPQPSQAFIEKYCKVGGIDEVEVEYECHMIDTWLPKVNSHNEITIHPIKDSWSEKEMFELYAKAKQEGYELGIKDSWTREELRMQLQYCVSLFAAEKKLTPTSTEMKEVNDWVDNWIKENLS